MFAPGWAGWLRLTIVKVSEGELFPAFRITGRLADAGSDWHSCCVSERMASR